MAFATEDGVGQQKSSTEEKTPGPVQKDTTTDVKSSEKTDRKFVQASFWNWGGPK